MFKLGFWEIVAICVIGILVVKPKDLPKVVNGIGKLYGNMTQFFRSMMRMVKQMDSEAERQTDASGAKNDTSPPVAHDGERQE